MLRHGNLTGIVARPDTAQWIHIARNALAGKSWEALLADYNLLDGRVWILVLLTELFGPPLFGWMQSMHKRGPRRENPQ